MSILLQEGARTGRPLPRLVRAVSRLVLRYKINETERWIRACEDDGILDSITLREIRADLCAMRVQLALLEPRQAVAPAPAAEAPTEQPEDSLAAARGLINAVPLGIAAWAIVLLLIALGAHVVAGA